MPAYSYIFVEWLSFSVSILAMKSTYSFLEAQSSSIFLCIIETYYLLPFYANDSSNVLITASFLSFSDLKSMIVYSNFASSGKNLLLRSLRSS